MVELQVYDCLIKKSSDFNNLVTISAGLFSLMHFCVFYLSNKLQGLNSWGVTTWRWLGYRTRFRWLG